MYLFYSKPTDLMNLPSFLGNVLDSPKAEGRTKKGIKNVFGEHCD